MAFRRLLTALLVLAATACGAPGPSDSLDQPTAIFNKGGLVLRYPTTWRSFDYRFQTSFSDLLGYLGSVPVADPCTRLPNGMQCGGTPYDLLPGTLVVTVVARYRFGDADIETLPLTTGGMPASYEAVGPATGSDRMQLTWQVASGPESVYEIRADLRGPGLDVMQAQVTAMVEGLRFDPPLVRLPGAPEERTAGARAALEAALRLLLRDYPMYTCFSPVPGERLITTTMISGSVDLVGPIPVTCSTKVEASRLELWRVVLTIELAEPTPDLARIVTTQWVTPVGLPTAMQQSWLP